MNLDALSTSNTFLTVMIDDFNAKSSSWYSNDITSFEGSQIEVFASQFAMSQVKGTNPYFRFFEVLHRCNIHITT